MYHDFLSAMFSQNMQRVKIGRSVRRALPVYDNACIQDLTPSLLLVELCSVVRFCHWQRCAMISITP